MQFLAVSIIGLSLTLFMDKMAELIGLKPIWGVALAASGMPLLNFRYHNL
jgi:hypothetical protein